MNAVREPVSHGLVKTATIVIGALAVMLYDAATSLVSAHFGTPRADFLAGSGLIYVLAGIAADRDGAPTVSIGFVAAAIGLIDATAGWFLITRICPDCAFVALPEWIPIAFTVWFAFEAGVLGVFVRRAFVFVRDCRAMLWTVD